MGAKELHANRLPGSGCPACGSTCHYETKKDSVWECADCGTKYPRPRYAEAAAKLEAAQQEAAA